MARYVSPNTNVIVDIQVDPLGVQAMMRTLEYNLSDQGLATFLEDEADPYIRHRIADRFAGEGDDVVGAWLSLAPTTQMIRIAKGFPPSHPINQRTHMMRDWLVQNQGDVKIGGADVSLTHPGPTNSGLTAQKIRTAQQGKTNPRTPPRPVVGVNQNDEMYLNAQLTLFLISGL